MNRNIEVIKLKLNAKSGGLDILYLESVEMKTERHNTTFPHRPIKGLINAIRKLSLHIPFMCEMEKDLTFAEVKEQHWKANEIGYYPIDILGFTAHGFALKQKEDKFVEIVGEKFLEFSSKSMKINTDYFVVTDDSEYNHSSELLKDICLIQELAAAYIDGEFDKSGTQYDIFGNRQNQDDDSGSNVEMLNSGKSNSILINSDVVLLLDNPSSDVEDSGVASVFGDFQEVTEEEDGIFPHNLEIHEEQQESEEEVISKKKVKKSSNLKPAKK